MPVSTLIQTKLQRPRLSPDLVVRPRLITRLNNGLDHRKLTLISAQAGAGKTTLLSQWLEDCPRPSAWLSLDEHDNDLMVFVSYLCAAIQTVFPEACGEALELMKAVKAPPPRIITQTLVNELGTPDKGQVPLGQGPHSNTGFILALDDYYKITDPAIHELLSDLITYLPQGLHLALASRIDPPLPLARLRAHLQMTEVRTTDLRLIHEEVEALLALATGRELSSETIELFEKKTEGWAVGLRLAALSVRDLPDLSVFAQRFQESSNSITVDYLVSEVLSQQTVACQEFLLQTSILERFNAELCDAILRQDGDTEPAEADLNNSPSRSILSELNAANLFLVPLDPEGWWYRYHHLFRDLLLYRLQQLHSPEHIAALHTLASRWFEENGFIEEALTYAFSAGDLDLAAEIVSRQRYELMNLARWRRLDRYLQLFPPEYVDQTPGLLMLRAWLLYHHTHYGQLPHTLAMLEALLEQEALSPQAIGHLKGEMSALRSLLFYYGSDLEQTILEANFSLDNTPPELWIVRILARIFLAGAYQARGDLRAAYDLIYRSMDQEVVQSDSLRATILITACNLHWIAADLQGLELAAVECLKLFSQPHAVEIKGFAHYHLGCVHYQRNDLAAAEEQFVIVVRQPYLNYGECFSHSAFGLALVYQAQNRAEEASEIASQAVAFMLETGNATLLAEAQAFQAELALRQDRLASAEQWAAQFTSIPPLSPMPRLYRPLLTLAKIWLACDTPTCRHQAAELLDQLQNYSESTHSTSLLIEVLLV